MRGNPVIRVLILAVALMMMAGIVMTVTRGLAATSPGAAAHSPATVAEIAPAVLLIQPSAPARSLSVRTGDGRTILIAPHQPPGTGDEFQFELPVDGLSTTLLLDLVWQSPAPNRFVRLVLEADERPTRELTIHAPVDLESHAVTFSWPPDPVPPSP